MYSIFFFKIEILFNYLKLIEIMFKTNEEYALLWKNKDLERRNLLLMSDLSSFWTRLLWVLFSYLYS